MNLKKKKKHTWNSQFPPYVVCRSIYKTSSHRASFELNENSISKSKPILVRAPSRKRRRKITYITYWPNRTLNAFRIQKYLYTQINNEHTHNEMYKNSHERKRKKRTNAQSTRVKTLKQQTTSHYLQFIICNSVWFRCITYKIWNANITDETHTFLLK